ncbi:MAG: MFS transporter [Marmoricola sp.]
MITNSPSTHERGGSAEPIDSGPMAWWRALDRRGRHAFRGAFLGYMLDSYDFWVLPLGLAAIALAFDLSTAQSGLLATTTLVASAFGGILGGILSDRIGRVRTLMFTVVTFAVFTAACGLAPNYESLLAFRALQGLGFGGEWAAGAVLMSEYAASRHRGRTVALIQSSWAVGWGLAVVAYTLIFTFVNDDIAWRVLFLTGALPALLILYIRRNIQDSPTFEDNRHLIDRGAIATIWKRDLRKITAFAVVLSAGTQGGYYTLATWVPTYLKTERGLSVIGTGGYLTFLISGAFAGYLTGGYFTDRIGRKNTFRIFAVLSGALIVVYTQLPEGANNLVLFLGFPLGFCSSAIFSGFGSYLSELFPITVRGTAQGFVYNVGRGIGAFFPTIIGFLAESYGIGGAMLFGAFAYALVVFALFWLPETANSELQTANAELA